MKSKFTYLLASLLLGCGPFFKAPAQDVLDYRYSYLSSTNSSIEALETYLNEQLSQTFELSLINRDSSLKGQHTTYSIGFDGTPLFQCYLKHNLYENNRQTVSFPALTTSPPEHVFPIDRTGLIRFSERLKSHEKLISADSYWILNSGKWKQRWVVKVQTSRGIDQSILNDQGEPIISKDLNLYDKPDSLVKINIYNPDPITTAEVEYGGAYTDNKDQANDALIEAMTTDSIFLRWSVDSLNNGQWRLISDFARAANFNTNDSGKITTPPPSFSAPSPDQLQVNRSHHHFEYFNAFYHINTIHDYLFYLGFKEIVHYPIAFDALASDGDQSSFTPNDTASRLRFGVGGVDDAEDAEVVVHEYGHAVLNSISPNSNLGAERAALEEGFCDYLALSYTRKISVYKPHEVMSWDGHNVFWDGRTLDYQRTYPTDLANEKYADGILWASSILRVADSIGLAVTDKILINSTYEWYPQMKLTDACRLFLKSDSLLNEAKNAEIASIIFCKRGLLPGCEDTAVSSLPYTDPYLGNTYDFAYNNEPLYIYPNDKSILLFEVLDIQGKLIFERKVEQDDGLYIPFYGQNLRQGIYILRLHTNTGPYSFKIMRTWF